MSTQDESVTQAIESFRRDLGIRRSLNTVDAYTTALRHFEEFCGQLYQVASEMDVTDLSPDMVLSFVRWLQAENPVSPTTQDNYLTALTRFYRWLLLEGKAKFSLTDYTRLQERLADIRGRRPPRPLPHLPAEDAVQLLLDAAYACPLPDDPNPSNARRAMLRRLRNIALLETLRSTGSRVGEIVALRRGDLDYERQAAVVTGKGRKQRLVFFDPKAWSALTHYLRERADGASGRSLASLPLFARHDKGAGEQSLPLSTNTV
jgi:site-specific recombinase XerD